jgi:hypothetical protein
MCISVSVCYNIGLQSDPYLLYGRVSKWPHAEMRRENISFFKKPSEVATDYLH